MTDAPSAILQARQQFGAGRILDAERTLHDALRANPSNLALLNALVAFYLETNRPADSAKVLPRVIELAPAAPEPYHTLAALLNRLGRDAELTPLYERLIANRPDDALAHFNLACCLRREGQLEKALATHERAIALGLDHAEEAWTNIGVLRGELHRNEDARAAFETALSLNPRWIPALYNLALWQEEHGDPAAAGELFERILSIEPNYHHALARLAHVRKIEGRDDPLIARLSRTLTRSDLSSAVREDLQFALGKALDDSAAYDEAFAAFSAGNTQSRARVRPYDRAATEALFQSVRASFGPEWLRRCTPVSDARLLFICGMFRSGSTLLEQMLAGHPAIESGGEIGWFQGRIRLDAPGWPAELAGAPNDMLKALGEGYLEYLASTFPGATLVTDKRPDNFLLLGFLKGLFPNARVLHTIRDARDTALSIYFQQLGDSFGYACDLADIAHYMTCYRGLMAHWRDVLEASLLDVPYETLVQDPRAELNRVCRFLGIEWHDAMLAFQERTGRVRTASVWQVRQPLYAQSIGRWRHYAAHLGPLEALTEEMEP